MNKKLFDILLSLTAGSVIIIGLPYIIKGGDIIPYDSPLLPFVTTAIKNTSFLITSVFLFIAFCAIGYFRRNWIVLGFFSISIFPIITFFEIIKSPTSHNLWPFELLFYLFLMIFALAGAFAGNKIAQLRKAGEGGSS